MAPLIPFLLAALKSKTVQGLVVTAVSYVAQKHGVDPGTATDTLATVAQAAGVTWAGVGIRDAIKPLSLKIAAPAAPVKTRKKRGPNKAKGAATGGGAVEPAAQKRRATRQIVADLEGEKGAESETV